MNYIQKRINAFLPLTDMEQAFKYIRQQNFTLSEINSLSPEISRFFTPEKDAASHNCYMDFSRIVHLMHAEDALGDEFFFSPTQHISIARHPRYMPEITHTHDGFFEIQCLLSGSLSQTIEGISLTLSPGDLCFIAPHSMHAPLVENDETVMINILVRTNTLRSIFSNALSDYDVISEFITRILYGKTYQPLLVCRTHLDPLSFGLVLDMLGASGIEDVYTDKILSTMLQLLFLCLLKDHKDDFIIGAVLHKADENILSIIHYIQDHYNDISLTSLARHFNYSQSYLSSLIKSFYGQTFQELLADYRLKKAAELLVSSNTKVSDIVSSVGYTENSYFFRIFKKKFGMTPNEYRKKNKKNETDH